MAGAIGRVLTPRREISLGLKREGFVVRGVLRNYVRDPRSRFASCCP